MQVLENKYEVFPLERIIAEQALDLDKIIQRREPIILLSKINNLEREWVEQLEQSGIYDSDDLFSSTDHLSSILGRDADLVEDFVNRVRQGLETHVTHPRMKQNFPDNYVLIVVDENPHRAAILWKGLLVELESERDNYWFEVKTQLDALLIKMHQPKLVGLIRLDDPPQWLKSVAHLQNYVDNVPDKKDPVKWASSWGIHLDGINDSLMSQLLAIAYIVELAGIKKEET